MDGFLFLLMYQVRKSESPRSVQGLNSVASKSHCCLRGEGWNEEKAFPNQPCSQKGVFITEFQ